MTIAVDREKKNGLRHWNLLMPVDTVERAETLLPLALGLKGRAGDSHITLVGVTPVAKDTPLSEGARVAQSLRNDLGAMLKEDPAINRLGGSIVSHKPWEDIRALVDDRSEDHTLLLLPWQGDHTYLQADLTSALRDLPCDAVVCHAAVAQQEIKRILLPVRGGAFANLSLQLAVRLAQATGAEITLLRVLSNDDDPTSQMLRESFMGLSDTHPEITTELQVVGDPGAAILREMRDHQAIILGASAAHDGPAIGLVATLILQHSDITALVVKAKEPFRLPPASDHASKLPVLVRVEKWFAENTFRSAEFSDIDHLVELKQKQGLRISLGLPTLNEAATIGPLISIMRKSLMEDAPLLDEIVLIDSNSTDATRKIAAELGVSPFVHQEVLPGLGALRGKGEALWKGLYLLKGDVIVWMDTDIINPHPRFVYGIVGPLLADPTIQYCTGFYRHGLGADEDFARADGDSVTELLARPMINLFFPELSGLVQPLGGVCGGRRAALEQAPFYSGYGVEMGLLLDLLGRFDLKAIAQVDLERVERRDQGRRILSRRAFAVLQVFARRLRQKGMIDAQTPMEHTMKLLRSGEDKFHLEEVHVHEQQRPPMIEIKEYRGRHRKKA